MTDKITFYYNPMSRGRIVHWMLEEVGADYEYKIIDLSKDEQKSPDFLKINPMGKLPAIIHKNNVVTETAAICAYLADAFPEAGLAPAVNDPLRGTYYRWIFFTINCVEQAVADRNLPRVNPDSPSRSGYGTFEDTMKTLEGAISGGFLVGNKFSTADLYLSSVLGWYIFQKMLEPTPTMMKYLELCGQREGSKRFNEKVTALMSK